MPKFTDWDPYKRNIGKCEICGEELELHRILGDDCREWHVCKGCLKEQWKIDEDNQR